VNTIVVMEIFYLFSIRYVHSTSLTWRAMLGTPAVLAGVATVTIAQLVLTYWPPMQAVFQTRPVAFLDGVIVVAVGVALLFVLELEKRIVSAAAARQRVRRSSQVR
jgi:magnesium-transporting ATPase (P-type)